MKNKRSVSLLIVSFVFLFVLFTVSGALAADSISQRDLEPVVYYSETGDVAIVPADPSAYPDKEVSNLVTEVNSGKPVSPAEIVERLKQEEGKQDAENFPLTTGETVNLELYDSLTGFYDFGSIANTRATPGVVSFRLAETVGMRGEDLLILQIDPATGSVYLIPLTAFDPETGEMKVNFVNNGPFQVISKLRLVDRVIDPDRYPSKEVADVVRKLSADKYITLRDFLNAQGIQDKTLSFEAVDEATGKSRNVTVNVDDYEAVTLLEDVALRLGVKDFGYDLSTKIKANLYQDLDRTNWTKILNYAKVDYDLNKVKKDPNLLMEVQPFTLKDAFIYHVDAATGEVSVVYEPTISFDTYDEEVGQEIELQNNQDGQEAVSETTSSIRDLFDDSVYAEMKPVDRDKVTWFDVDDIDEDNTSNLNMVISGNGYLGMGPFILVTHKVSAVDSLWWLWILLGVVVASGIGAFIYNKKKNAQEQA